MGNPIRKSSLFLMELAIALLFFSLACAYSVEVFAKANIISRGSYELTNAVKYADNIISLIRASDGQISVLDEIYPSIEHQDISSLGISFDKINTSPKRLICFDENWNHTQHENIRYVISISEDDDIQTTYISVYKINTHTPILEYEVYTHRQYLLEEGTIK